MANVLLGMDNTKDISLDEMINHTKAVSKACKNALIVGDMPYCSYQAKGSDVLKNAKKFIKAGCDAVKIEWYTGVIESIKN